MLVTVQLPRLVKSCDNTVAVALAVELRSMLSPAQIVDCDAEATTPVGGAEEVMVVVAEAEHPLPSVPITVYVVFPEGDASTDAPVVEVRPAEGAQLNVVAPVAFSVMAGEPAQNVADAGVTPTTGNAFTVSVTDDVEIVAQPSVTVSV